MYSRKCKVNFVLNHTVKLEQENLVLVDTFYYQTHE